MKIKIIFLFLILFLLILLMIDTNKEKIIIVSVHDANPYFEEELKIIFSELDKLNIKPTILVTPKIDDKDINDYQSFLELIKEQETEVALHGYTHDKYEFSGSYKDSKQNLEDAVNIFNKAFGYKPKGFVPGFWKQNKDSIKAAEELNFTYTTTLTKITIFDKKKIRTLPTCMVGYNKFTTSLIKLYSSLYLKLNNKIIRFTIHPGELRVKTFDYNMKLLKQKLDKGYIPINYEELSKNKIMSNYRHL